MRWGVQAAVLLAAGGAGCQVVSDAFTDDESAVRRLADGVEPISGITLEVIGDGSQSGDGAQLQWNAISESGFSGYTVYRTSYGDSATMSTPGERVRLGIVREPFYTDPQIETFVTYEYAITALFKDGSETAERNSVRIAVRADYVCPGCSVTDICNDGKGDAHEPNDSRRRAAEIDIGAGIRLGSLTAEDPDWYRFETTAGALLIRTLPVGPPDGISLDSRISLYKLGEADPAVTDDNSGYAALSQIMFAVPETSTYELHVSSPTEIGSPTACNSPYGLSIQYVKPGDIAIADVRTEPEIFRIGDSVKLRIEVDTRLAAKDVRVTGTLQAMYNGPAPITNPINHPNLLSCISPTDIPKGGVFDIGCSATVAPVANGLYPVRARVTPHNDPDVSAASNELSLPSLQQVFEPDCNDDLLEENDFYERPASAIPSQLSNLKFLDNDFYRMETAPGVTYRWGISSSDGAAGIAGWDRFGQELFSGSNSAGRAYGNWTADVTETVLHGQISTVCGNYDLHFAPLPPTQPTLDTDFSIATASATAFGLQVSLDLTAQQTGLDFVEYQDLEIDVWVDAVPPQPNTVPLQSSGRFRFSLPRQTIGPAWLHTEHLDFMLTRGAHYMYVVADSLDYVRETDEANNIFGPIDLVIP